MDCHDSKRRPGSENGPQQFSKVLKYSILAAINDDRSNYLDCFAFFGTDVHLFDFAGFKAKFSVIAEHLTAKDLTVCIGGGSSILNVLATQDSKIDSIIKISPNLSRGDFSTGNKMTNSNYITCLDEATRSKIIHFGILDYTNTQKEVDLVVKQDKAKVMFLDKMGRGNSKLFAEMLKGLKEGTNVTIIIDGESLTPDYFPGVSNPAIFGLEEKEIFEIMEIMGNTHVNFKHICFTNYNPAVESRRTGDCLTYFLYTLFKSLKTSSGSILSGLS